MFRYLFAYSLTMTLLFVYSHSMHAEESYMYVEKTGEQTKSFDWSLALSPNTVEIESYQGKERFYCNTDRTGATREWIYTNQENIIRVTRQSNTLFINGRLDKDQVYKKIEIDSLPWFQALTYSLRGFINSNHDSVEFWHIRQDTYEPVKLTATKAENNEADQCDGENVHKIEIRPSGFFAKFWHASYWFREYDDLFCRYEGRHGAWGTPLTIITLSEEG